MSEFYVAIILWKNGSTWINFFYLFIYKQKKTREIPGEMERVGQSVIKRIQSCILEQRILFTSNISDEDMQIQFLKYKTHYTQLENKIKQGIYLRAIFIVFMCKIHGRNIKLVLEYNSVWAHVDPITEDIGKFNHYVNLSEFCQT